MKITLVLGDITKMEVDAVVNAANRSLLGGGGVDGAIHQAGGPEILEECRQIVAKQGGCMTGDAVITTAGNLPAKFVIHTVGPVWNSGLHNEELYLKKCYINSLKLAVKNQCRSVAFPAISTGAYRFPKGKAAEIAVEAVTEFLAANEAIEKVIFVCFDLELYSIYQEILGVPQNQNN